MSNILKYVYLMTQITRFNLNIILMVTWLMAILLGNWVLT